MLEFKVTNQLLARVDNSHPATDSVDYLKAKFLFNSTDWNGKTKTALFRRGTETYKKILNSDGTCTIPSEVLVASSDSKSRIASNKNKIYVSVVGEYGTIRVPTNEVMVELNLSGYNEALTPKEPTETEYQQIVTQYENARSEMQEATEECQNAQERLDGVGNLFANAIKGNLSGSAVFADDVSQIEHNPSVLLHGKNFFDVSKITNTDTATNNGDGSITIRANTYYCRLNQKLREVCPQLRAGDVVVLSFKTGSSAIHYMYFHGLQGTWIVGHYITMTDAILDSYITVYGYPDNDANYGQENVISNIQIEKGTVVTNYEPYIDPSTVTVRRCGKNLIPFNDSLESTTVKGITFTVNDDKSITCNGTATANATFNLTENFVLPIGRYVLRGCPSNGSDSVRIQTNKIIDGVASTGAIDIGTGCALPVTGQCKLYTYLVVLSGQTVSNFTFKPSIQFESDTDIVYETPNSEVYTPNADGTVEGITSLSPNMTILTDTEGVIVECEYNKDTNVVVKKLADALGITI